MRIVIEMTEKHFLLLVGVLVVVSAIGIVTGYGTSDPQTMGHSLGELSPGTFPAGQYTFPDNVIVNGMLGVGKNPVSAIDVNGQINGTGGRADCGSAYMEITNCRSSYYVIYFQACDFRVCNNCGCGQWNPGGTQIIRAAPGY